MTQLIFNSPLNDINFSKTIKSQAISPKGRKIQINEAMQNKSLVSARFKYQQVLEEKNLLQENHARGGNLQKIQESQVSTKMKGSYHHGDQPKINPNQSIKEEASCKEQKR